MRSGHTSLGNTMM